MKSIAASVGVVTGAAALKRRFHKASLRILMYHGIVERLRGPAAFGNLFLSAESLTHHLRFLQRTFTVISLEEAVDRLRDGRRLPDRAVAVTFDDGYRNVLTTALPIARACGVPITVFVPAAQVNQGTCSWFDVLRVVVTESIRQRRRMRIGQMLVVDGDSIKHPETTFLELSQWIISLPDTQAIAVIDQLEMVGQELGALRRHPEFALASWEEWRRAVADGLVAVGSHALTHRNLRHLAPEACLHELTTSKQLIEQRLDRPCRILAYPYGAWDTRVAEAARAAGYAAAVTTDDGLNVAGSDLFALRRTTVGDKGDFSLFCARSSGLWSSGLLRASQNGSSRRR